MRIGIDAMGGDHAPAEEIKGALAARDLLGPEDRLVLIGDEPAIRKCLDGTEDWQNSIEIRHAEEVICMDDSPVEGLRSKPNSSIAIMVQMHRNKELDACISAGNTGAIVAAAQMRLRRLQGVHRPGIAIVTPTLHGPVALCDVGANLNCRPQHLHQYGIMASVYIEAICGIEKPRVALLSIGEEDGKGNELVKRTRQLMKGDPNLNFIGNLESRDLFGGTCDVLVCEGFVGNVVLKLMEGMAEGVIKALLGEVAAGMPDQVGVIKSTGRDILAKYDFNEYGGAPLLGVNGIFVICHGATNSRGIMNAVRVAADLVKRQVNQRIIKLLSHDRGTLL